MMSTLRKIHIGLGLAFVTAFAFVLSSAPASAADTEVDDPSTGEVVDAIPGATYQCTMSSLTNPFGRDAAQLVVLPNGWHCARQRTGGPGFVGAPSCHRVARFVGCQLIN
ncbi:hypothetical protein [Sorangium sp. So ce854]|uniref:hypothetical protein n=1 Tax=Sorangium sp. So ce854 TaxID=3133322 RepID=UPI003F5ED07D